MCFGILHSSYIQNYFYNSEESCEIVVCHISSTFDGDFNLAVWRFFLNWQTKIAANDIFKRTLWEYLMAIPGQSAKLNVHQSVFVAKSPNLMPAECATPTICMLNMK